MTTRAIADLERALAQQDEPVEDVLLSAAGLALDALEHDRQAAARSGRSISMLSSRAIEELRGALRAALAQRAEPEGSVCARCGALAFDPVVPQQAEPLNLRDPAVQKRLATQWGYVPAAQAEPVEPVAWECKAGGLKPLTQRQYDAQTAATKRHYTRIAPPQRKPLTDEEIVDAVREADLDWHSGWTLDEHEPNRFTTLVRAVEQAHGIKE